MKEGWEYKKLGEVGVVITGNTPSTKDNRNYESEDYCFVKPSDIQKDGITKLNQSEYHISEYAYENSRKLPKGSVLTTCIGIIGKVGILQIDATCNQQINAIIPSPLIDSSFLAYTILSSRKQLENIANAPVVPIINKKEFANIPIQVPPLSEQQHIVEELDLLSSIIEKKKAQLNELDHLAQSLFYEMFGDPITNEKGWEVKKIGEIGKVITGSTPSTKDGGNYNSCDYCFIKPSDIAKDNITRLFESEFYISSKAYDNSRQLPKGSVLVTCIGIVGKVGILEVNATCNQQINAIVPHSFVQSQYLAYSILLQKEIIESIANAPVVPIINKKEFSSLSTPIPPLDLQNQFASKIEAIEHQKELIKQSIKEAETLFNSRMDYYFN